MEPTGLPAHRRRRPARRRLVARPRVTGVVVVLVVLGALVACGTDDDGDRPRAETGAPSPTGDPTTTQETTTVADRTTADGTLDVEARGARLFLTATAGDEPLVVPDDLSDAEVDADDDRWSVVVRVPRRSTGGDAEAPGSTALVVQPGEDVEVGPYELGPRPPASVSLCLEVVEPTSAERDLPTGSSVRVAAPEGEGRFLCGEVTTG